MNEIENAHVDPFLIESMLYQLHVFCRALLHAWAAFSMHLESFVSDLVVDVILYKILAISFLFKISCAAVQR